MAGVSSDLLWLLVRNNSKFLHKQGGRTTSAVSFTCEPFNLTNKNAFKFSGLANSKAVGLEADGEAVVLTTKKVKKGLLPSSAVQRSLLKKDVRKMAKTIINQVVTNQYRPDLKKAALARLSAIHKSLRVAKAGSKSKGKKLAKK